MSQSTPSSGKSSVSEKSLSVLLPYQKAWISDRSTLKIAEKSRRTGLTWAEAADAVLEASISGGEHHHYLGAGKEMAQEFIEAAAMWAKAFDRAAGEIEEEVLQDQDKDILTYTIRFASGCKVQALSSSPSNLRGRKGNVTVDEAAFHDHLAEVLKAALPLRMWGGRIRLISTHNGVENLFNDLIEDSRAGKQPYSLHRITLDDACQQGLYRRICQVRGLRWTSESEADWKEKLFSGCATREDAEEEYQCVPKQSGGAYLSRALIEACMVEAPVLRFESPAGFDVWGESLREQEVRDWCLEHLEPLLVQLDPTRPHCFGEDFGRSADLTVLAPLELGQQMVNRVPFLVELRNVPYRQQEQILFFLVDRLPRFRSGALDARGNGGYLAEQAAYKYGRGRIEPIQLSQAWYLENMPRFKSRFEDKLFQIPRDREVLDDLRALQVVKGIPKLPDAKTGQKKDRHGDAAIALAIAEYAARKDPVVYEYHRVPKLGSRAWRKDRRFRDLGRKRMVRTTGGFHRGSI